MVAKLEETGAVPSRLALKRRSLKEELMVQGRDREMGRNKMEMVQRKTRESAIQGKKMVLELQGQGEDNKDICDNRIILGNSYSEERSTVGVKKPPLLKRRSVMREKQVQEQMKVTKELKVDKELLEEGASVKPVKLEEKAKVKQRLERRLSRR